MCRFDKNVLNTMQLVCSFGWTSPVVCLFVNIVMKFVSISISLLEIKLDIGYISPYFITNNKLQKCEMESPPPGQTQLTLHWAIGEVIN